MARSRGWASPAQAARYTAQRQASLARQKTQGNMIQTDLGPVPKRNISAKNRRNSPFYQSAMASRGTPTVTRNVRSA